MLSAHGIVNQNVSRVPDMQSMLGGAELPETGAFDFLNYLLGLQVNSGDQMQGQEAQLFGIAKGTESSESKDLLQTLLEKKEQPLWNPMIPVGTTLGPQNAINVKNDVAETGLEKLNVSSSDGNKKDTSQLLENRLLEPKHFLEAREKRTDVDFALDTVASNDSGDKTSQEVKPLETQKLKGIEKYNELAQLKTQSEPGNSSVESTKTVREMVQQANVGREVSEETVRETKPSEKKKNEDLNSAFVVLGSNGHSSKISDGGKVSNEHSQPRETVALPEVFKKVESMIHHGGGKMTVELSPPELGKLEVHVAMKGNQVEVKMRSDNEVAKVALESHLGDLKHAMDGQNLTLHKVEVQVGLDMRSSSQERQFAAFSGNQQSESNRQSFQSSHRNSVPSYRSEASIRSVSQAYRPVSKGGVDIRI